MSSSQFVGALACLVLLAGCGDDASTSASEETVAQDVAWEASGSQVLHGLSNDDPPPPLGVPMTEVYTGFVAQGANVYFGPFILALGSTISVEMTGRWDPDLYVRFGAAPTQHLYQCRPYAPDANENCVLHSSGHGAAAYVMVHGHTDATYMLTINYVAP